MPIVPLPDKRLSYHLISYDARGSECRHDDDGPMVSRTLEALERDKVTEVFLLSHGWKGDFPEAKKQYNLWLAAALECKADLDRLRARPGGFRPLVIGIHWPSLPFGDEEFVPDSAAFATVVGPMPTETLVELYASRLVDAAEARDRARAALRTIFAGAERDDAPDQLPDDVRKAYDTLNQTTGLGSAGLAGAPGDDRDEFNPDRIFEDASDAASQAFGILGSVRDLILSPLRQLSFWKMKDRARRVGEAGVHDLVRSLLEQSPEVRVHIMGHSFGCIVISAAVAGPEKGKGLPGPVQSLTLVQGALSLWSYCDDIPHIEHKPEEPPSAGYFRRVMEGGVAGPVITTRSQFDTAVGRWYPMGVRLAGQVAFARTDFPRYGGVGAFGLRGPGLDLAPDKLLLPAEKPYEFQGGRVYNFDGSTVIRKGGGASGAHSDIAYPEVAHLVWSAALAGETATQPARAASHTAKGPTAKDDRSELTLAELLRVAGQAAAARHVRVRVEIDIDPPPPSGTKSNI